MLLQVIVLIQDLKLIKFPTGKLEFFKRSHINEIILSFIDDLKDYHAKQKKKQSSDNLNIHSQLNEFSELLFLGQPCIMVLKSIGSLYVKDSDLLDYR